MHLGRLLESCVEDYGDFERIVSLEGRAWSSVECLEASRRLAGGLVELGFRPGDRIITLLPNSPYVFIAYSAAWQAGLVLVPLHPLTGSGEIARRARSSHARGVLVAEHLVDSVVEAALPDVRVVVVPRGDAATTSERAGSSFESYSSLIAHAKPLAEVRAPVADLAAILYTGGTTGRPKGVQLTHANIWHAIHSLANQDKRWTGLWFLPLSHSSGFLYPQMWQRFGYRMVLVEPTPEAILTNIERHRANVIASVPSLFVAMQAHPDADRFDVSSVKHWLFGGAPFPEEQVRLFEQKFGGHLHGVYGLTETCALATGSELQGRRKPGSVGRPPATSDFRIRIVGPHGDVPTGEPGEIWIKGTAVTSGYLDLAEESHEALTDGWLHTGDIGRLDEDGDLFLAGRSKDIIIRGGANVYPEEVESILLEHPAVADCVVVGVPNDLLGEEVVALIVLRAGASAEALEELAAFCRKNLSAYKVPRFEVIEAIPRTAIGKTDRQGARALAVERLQSGADTPARLAIRRAPAKRRRALVTALVRESISEILGVAERELELTTGFGELGMQSAQAVELAFTLGSKLGIQLSGTLAFKAPTGEALVDELLALLFPTTAATSRPRRARADEPIAVVGMAFKLPGGIVDDESLWRVLERGLDTAEQAPAWRWNNELHPGSYRGNFVRDIDTFDPTVFGIIPAEARDMDPQQRVLLETCWSALENAGIAPGSLVGSATGVYVGTGPTDYLYEHLGLVGYGGSTGGIHAVSVGRVSYVLGLRGPSVAMDTACSASMTATHHAIRALRDGDCELALVGGVSLCLSPAAFTSLSMVRALAPDGRCKTFDAAADGYGRAEGCGILVLMRLSDAIARGHTIRAILRGSAINHDGTSATLTAPNREAQEEMLHAALQDAGLAPGDVTMIEAHGTGTPTGDPIEVDALTRVLCRSARPRMYLSSTKAILGHLEYAAGVAGMARVILSLERGELTPLAQLRTLNPLVRLDDANITIPTERVPLRAPRRIAGISSFGIGGSNAHVILESAPAQPASSTPRRVHVLPLSAKTPAALARLVTRYMRQLAMYPSLSLADACFTAGVGRSHFEHRLAIVVPEGGTLRPALVDASSGASRADLARGQRPAAGPGVTAMRFAGGDALGRGVGMAKAIYADEPVFRDAFDACRAHFERELAAPLEAFATQWALHALWTAWGVEPDVVIGEGIGEIAAAAAAGVLSLADACKLAAAHVRWASAPGETSLEAFREVAKAVRYEQAAIPIACSVSGTIDDAAPTRAEYWIEQLTAPSRSSAAVEAIVAMGCRQIIELGPAHEGARHDGVASLPSLERDVPADRVLARSVAQFYARGGHIDWHAFHAHAHSRRIPLPTYPFERTRFWVERKSGEGFADTAPALRARPAELLVLSERSDETLAALARDWAGRVERSQDGELAELATTAGRARAQSEQRAAILMDDRASAREALAALADGRAHPNVTRGRTPGAPPRIAFLFTGQGAQYEGMGQKLYATEPVFRASLDELAALVASELPRPLLDVMFAGGSEIHQTGYAQPALVALELSLARLWESWGIRPWGVLGHSVGEIAAACVAGVVSAQDAMRLAATRGRLMQALPAGGAMLSVRAGAFDVAEAIARWSEQVSIAGVNGPNATVISGAGAAIAAIDRELKARGWKTRALEVSHAFHSHLLDPMLAAFEASAAVVPYRPAKCTWISNVTGRSITSADAGYWRTHARVPVQFQAGMQALAAGGANVFVEIGPSPVLCTMASTFVGDATWVPSIEPPHDDARRVLEALAKLYVRGAAIDWRAVHEGRARRAMVAPGAAAPASPPAASGHPLLGERLPSASRVVQFESWLAADRPRYLDGHRIHGMTVFPATGYLEQVFSAVRTLWGNGVPAQCAIEAFVLERALVLDDEPRRVQVVLTPEGEAADTHRFEIHSSSDAEAWTRHVHGVVRRSAAAASANASSIEAFRASGEPGNSSAFYEELTAQGLEYTGSFRAVSELWTSSSAPGQALGRVACADAGHIVHPALFDGCLQIVAAARRTLAGAPEGVYLPASIERISLYGGASEAFCHATLRVPDAATMIADLHVVDERGQPLVDIAGLVFRRVERSARQLTNADPRDDMYEVAWKARPLAAVPRALGGTSWWIVGDGEGIAAPLARELEALGARCVLASDDRAFDEPPTGVIALAAVRSQPAPSSADELFRAVRSACGSALGLVHRLAASSAAAPPRLVLVTRGAHRVVHGDDVDPAQASSWGLGRVIAEEAPELRCTMIDLEGEGAVDAAVRTLLDELTRGDDEPQLAWRGTERSAARLVRARSPRDRLVRPATSFALVTRQPGILDALHLEPIERRAPGQGEVEVEVHAAALNFRDVMNALGTYPGGPEPLGGECAGRISAVGDGVAFKVGDEVVVGLTRGALRSFAVADARHVARKPKFLSFGEAAGMPIAFLTAEYALRHLSRVLPGERVLIHAGAGGVGIAAIQLARQLGAEVFATAGSPRKRALLHRLGVAHVMNSRTLEFADQIREITGGAGVDVVLNSLAGEFVAASLSTLRPGGRFVEIGKVGLLEASQVPSHLTYHHFDLGDVCNSQPELWQAMFARIVGQLEAGALRPLPHESYPIEEARAAFRTMAQGRHVGKLIVTLASAGPIHAHASYLVTGGLGGLGLGIARWLVERGAGRIVLVGRRPPSEAARALLDELAQRAVVTVVQADIANHDDVRDMLASIRREGPPLRGIVHAAGVLDDAMLARQTWESFERVMAPKVLGAFHLHQLTAGDRLDWFVMCSSMSALLGSAGQANYAAANSFLDGLAQHRRGIGLPTLSVNWGAFRDVGMAADPARLAALAARGVESLSVEEGIAGLELMLAGTSPQLGFMPVNWQKLANGRVLGSGLLADLVTAPRAKAETSETPRVAIENVEELLRDEICRVLDLDPATHIDLAQPIAVLGLDSLVAVELRNRLAKRFAKHLPATLLFDYPTIEALAGYLRANVLGPPAKPEPRPSPPAPTAPLTTGQDRVAAILSAIASLSDDEQTQLLDHLVQPDA